MATRTSCTVKCQVRFLSSYTIKPVTNRGKQAREIRRDDAHPTMMPASGVYYRGLVLVHLEQDKMTEKEFRDRISKTSLYVMSIRRGWNEWWELVLTNELSFDVLQEVSKALGTTEINVRGNTEHGYYGETESYLTLDIKI